jgi:hypothetical protein
VKLLQEEERKKALRDLNDIQYIMFEHCIAQYKKGKMDEFWNDIESLDVLFGLSTKILEEELMNP